MYEEVQREGDKRVPHGGRACGRLVYGSIRRAYFNAEFSPERERAATTTARWKTLDLRCYPRMP